MPARNNGTYGPRLTAGGYRLVGLKATWDKGGVLLGYEQPLARRAAFVADWVNGRNSFGYVTPGFSFSLPRMQVINLGYSFGNAGRKNNGSFVYYGITF